MVEQLYIIASTVFFIVFAVWWGKKSILDLCIKITLTILAAAGILVSLLQFGYLVKV